MRDLLPPVRFHYKLDDPTTTTTTLPFLAQNLPPLRQIPNSRFRLQSPISHTYVHIIRTYNTTFFLDKSSRAVESEKMRKEERKESVLLCPVISVLLAIRREREKKWKNGRTTTVFPRTDGCCWRPDDPHGNPAKS